MSRIDKWLWAVRIFKTRTIASDACKLGRVTIGGQKVKASRTVKVGEVIEVRKPPVTYSFKVLALTENRMGAKLVPGFMENVTPKDQLEILELNRMNGFIDRAKGLGRPTKKDRRDIDEFNTPEYIDEFDYSLDDLEELEAQNTKEIMGKKKKKKKRPVSQQTIFTNLKSYTMKNTMQRYIIFLNLARLFEKNYKTNRKW